MRIGVDIRALAGPICGGVGEYAYHLLGALTALDCANDYHFYSNCFKRSKPDKLDLSGARIHYHRHRIPNALNHFTIKFLVQPKLDALLRSDIFFAPNLNFLALRDYSRAVLTVHDLSFLRFREFFSKKQMAWHNSLGAAKLAGKVGKLVAVSENTKRDLVELCGADAGKITVIYSGINPIFVSAPADFLKEKAVRQRYNLPDRYILSLGTLEPRKNLTGLIEAYGIFRDKNKDLHGIKLVIAGSAGWKTGPIFSAREKSKYRNDIVMAGYVRPPDKPALYSQALLFAYPSFYEGFGFPPLEAMASGLPVVAGLNSSMSEILGGAALLVNSADSEELACAFRLLACEPGLRSRYVKLGAEKASGFCWPDAALKYLQLFNSLA